MALDLEDFLRASVGGRMSGISADLLRQLGITDATGVVQPGMSEAGVGTNFMGITPEAIAAAQEQGGGQVSIADLGGLNRRADVTRDGQSVASQAYQADAENFMDRLGPLAAFLPIAAGFGLQAMGVGAGAGGAGAAGGAAGAGAAAGGSGVVSGGSGLLAGSSAGLGGTGAGLSVGAGAGAGGLGSGIGSSIGAGLGTTGAGLGAAGGSGVITGGSGLIPGASSGGLLGGAGAATGAGAGSMGIFDGILGSIGSGLGSQLAGGLLGAVAGGRDDTTSQSSGPPAYAVPYINQVMQQAAQQYGTPYTPYTGFRVAGQSNGGLSGYEQNAFNAVQQQAAGTPSLQAAQAQFSQLAQGRNPFQVNGVAYGQASTVDPSIGGASNDYIGRTTEGARGAQAAAVGRNALLGMNNPFLQGAIDYAQGDVTRSYNNTIAPQQQAAQVASGSFGNAGLQQMQLEQQRNLAQELGRVSSGMRMQDYGLQAQLGESDLNRQQANNQFNAGLRQSNSQFNAGLSQADLARNAGLQQQLAQFNAGQAQQTGMFNAGAQNAMSQFNANTSNDMARFNAGTGANLMGMGLQGLMNVNNTQAQNAQALMGLGQINRGIEQQGLDAAYQAWREQQQYPQQQLGNYADIVRQMTFGGQQSQTQEGNPWMGAIGGMQIANGLFGGPTMTTAGPRTTTPTGIGAWTAPNYNLWSNA